MVVPNSLSQNRQSHEDPKWTLIDMPSPILYAEEPPSNVRISQQLHKQSEICESFRVQNGLKTLSGQQNLQELIIKLRANTLGHQFEQRLIVATMLDMCEHLHADLKCLIGCSMNVGVGLQLIREQLRLLQRERDEVLDDFKGILDELLRIMTAIPSLIDRHIRPVPTILKMLEDVHAGHLQQLDQHRIEVRRMLDQ